MEAVPRYGVLERRAERVAQPSRLWEAFGHAPFFFYLFAPCYGSAKITTAVSKAEYILLSVRGDAQREILVAGAIFLAVLILAVFLVYWLRRKWDPRRGQGADQDGKLTIEQIESMHQTGQISDEEFTAMRRVAMGLDSTAEKNSESSCGGVE